MYLVDTDILGYLQRGQSRVTQRFLAVPRHELATTIINRIEILKARYEAVLKAANGTELRVAQHWLDESERLLSEWLVARIDESASVQFDRLSKQRSLRKIGRADLLIASIALSKKATLVTRNVRDFALIQQLRIENWMD
jgi:tRNA(fMet)-specific endonuclease VapC